MDLVCNDYESDSDSGWALRVGVCDSRGGEGRLERSSNEITSLEDIARGLHKLSALHAWRRERRYGLEYSITSPWPCNKATYLGLDWKEVDVRGSSLGDFQGIVSRACMSPEHVCVFLSQEEEGPGRRGGDALGRFSLVDHDSYVGMATWLHKLWGEHTGNEVAPGTWVSRVADSWPGYHVRIMSRDNEEMDEGTVDFQDCLLKLERISIVRTKQIRLLCLLGLPSYAIQSFMMLSVTY